MQGGYLSDVHVFVPEWVDSASCVGVRQSLIYPTPYDRHISKRKGQGHNRNGKRLIVMTNDCKWFNLFFVLCHLAFLAQDFKTLARLQDHPDNKRGFKHYMPHLHNVLWLTKFRVHFLILSIALIQVTRNHNTYYMIYLNNIKLSKMCHLYKTMSKRVVLFLTR